jgi:hypothetical protein
MPSATTQPRAAEPAKRLSLSEIVGMLLTRSGSANNSSVTLSRNAKGDTQIEVTVRTDDEDGLRTPEEAAARARAIYDTLRSAYPLASGHVGAVAP